MKRSKPTIIDMLIRFVALILAVCLLLGCIAGNIDPRESKYIPFFGLAYPYFLVLNVFMADCRDYCGRLAGCLRNLQVLW
jgi:hypothetical protein